MTSAMSVPKRKKMVLRKFKLRGFALKVDALDVILSWVSRFPDAEEDPLDLLLDEIDKESLQSSILDRDPIERVVTRLMELEAVMDTSTVSSAGNRLAWRFINAFVIPRFRFDPIRRVFYEHAGRLPIHGDASEKAALYRDRFQLLYQRLSRDTYFSRRPFDIEMRGSETCEITPILSLIGCTGRRWIMGVISQLEEGRFFLEDLSTSVPIDLSNAKTTSGFFVENTIIIAEGELLSNGTFQVNTCGFPPVENRDSSKSSIMGLDFFGCGILSREETLRLAELEKKAVNDMFVVLSDVWLDSEEIFEKLSVVLDGYENQDMVPTLFILMGNFCSRPCNLAFRSYSSLRMQFAKFGEMIESHPRLNEQSRFLFIPGPEDAGPSRALPRCALPDYLIAELKNHVPNAMFNSNPCRMKFYAQEITIFRQDLLYRMRRSSLIPPCAEDTKEPFEHLVATITHQSHLCPLPLTVQPIIWAYDHSLRLYPSPHVIVLGDRSEPKAFKYKGITCFNPGSFSNDSTFAVYWPSSQEVELSSL